MIELGREHIVIEHEGEIFRLSGELTSNDFIAWLSWTERFPNKQALSEYDQSREKYVTEELSRLYGNLPRKDLPPDEWANLMSTIMRLYQEKKQVFSGQEQTQIMNIVCKHWNDEKFPIYFVDDNLNELCCTKKEAAKDQGTLKRKRFRKAKERTK